MRSGRSGSAPAAFAPGKIRISSTYSRINFDGTGLVILTEGDGTHDIDFSPDRRFFLDTYSRVDLPPVTELRRSDDGKLVCELERADIGGPKATGWKPPERFVAKGRDGKTDIYGVIFRPTNFDPAKKYPVIEHIYAGPHGSFVPKAFAAITRASWRSWASSSCRSTAWARQLARRRFTTSAGRTWAMRLPRPHSLDEGGGREAALDGPAARRHLRRLAPAGRTRCGRSAAPRRLLQGRRRRLRLPRQSHGQDLVERTVDGLAGRPAYAEQSNMTNAHKLQGKLLLIVGELDPNVDPASTMQVVNALVKADKDFDLLVVPGTGHGAAETAYGQRGRMASSCGPVGQGAPLDRMSTAARPRKPTRRRTR